MANCTRCPKGTYQNKPGMDFCYPCLVGQYQNATASVSCLNCERCKATEYWDVGCEADPRIPESLDDPELIDSDPSY